MLAALKVNEAVEFLEVTPGSCICLYLHTVHCICPQSNQKCESTESRKSFASFYLLKAGISSSVSTEGFYVG